MKKVMLIGVLLAVAGCNLVKTPDGKIIHASQGPGTPIPTDVVIEQVARDVAPLAPFVPYGSAVVAAILAGVGIYRKNKPQVDVLKEIVTNVEKLPDDAKKAFKDEMDKLGMTVNSQIAVKKLKATT